jgi:hypothetical protein
MAMDWVGPLPVHVALSERRSSMKLDAPVTVRRKSLSPSVCRLEPVVASTASLDELSFVTRSSGSAPGRTMNASPACGVPAASDRRMPSITIGMLVDGANVLLSDRRVTL